MPKPLTEAVAKDLLEKHLQVLEQKVQMYLTCGRGGPSCYHLSPDLYGYYITARLTDGSTREYEILPDGRVLKLGKVLVLNGIPQRPY